MNGLVYFEVKLVNLCKQILSLSILLTNLYIFGNKFYRCVFSPYIFIFYLPAACVNFNSIKVAMASIVTEPCF